MPSATPKELAAAIIECIDAGARVINLSLALAQPSTTGEQSLEDALDQAVRRGVIVVVAAGNQGTIGSSAITRHPWVIPVVACDLRGRPMNESNLGGSIGRRGLRAPGDGITSLGAEGQSLTLGGTSVAVPFVTGAAALLWSAFPSATAAHIKLAVTQASAPRRASVVPPLLDAAAAYRLLSARMRGGEQHEEGSERHRLSGDGANCRLTACACPDLSPTRRSGLATSIKRATSYIGIRPCGGCDRRAAALNRWMVFTPRHQMQEQAGREEQHA